MKRATPIPNSFFDYHLATLKPSETHVLLTIFRQTIGWQDSYTGGRKKKDWITTSQFMKRTGLSDKTVTSAIDGLIEKQLITVTDLYGNVLYSPEQRRGKTRIYYEPRFKSSRNSGETPQI